MGLERFSAGDVVIGCGAGIMTLRRDAGLMGDDIVRLTRDRELFAERADLREGAGGLGGDHDLERVAGRFGGLRIGVGGFDGAAHLAEQINFVADLENILVQP